MKRFLKTSLSILSILFISIALVGCGEKVDPADVAVKLINYNQENVVPKVIDGLLSSQSNAVEKVYEETNAKLKEEFSSYMSENALDTYLLKSQSALVTYLSEQKLPITMGEPKVEEGSSQIITIPFKDASQNEGELVFQVQMRDGKIGFIKFVQ